MTSREPGESQALMDAEHHYRQLIKWIGFVEAQVLEKGKTLPGHAMAAAMNLRYQLTLRSIGQAIEELRGATQEQALQEKMSGRVLGTGGGASTGSIVLPQTSVKMTESQLRGKK